ncbi:MAG: DUF1844 domain-containing protein [Planctomycetota bacterium]|nr:DUF1844 domain-containing protein [Planctomycetota bacterium]
MSSGEAPKLIIDSDWKAQAQAEKAKVAAAAEAKAASTAGAPASGKAPADDNRPIGFEDLLSLLASQALLYMGAFPDRSGRAVVALDMAKLHIDLLGVVEQKTKGNLTAEESTMLQKMGHELRMEFVEVSKEVAKAVQEGRLKPQSASGAMGGGLGGAPTLNLNPGPGPSMGPSGGMSFGGTSGPGSGAGPVKF